MACSTSGKPQAACFLQSEGGRNIFHPGGEDSWSCAQGTVLHTEVEVM